MTNICPVFFYIFISEKYLVLYYLSINVKYVSMYFFIFISEKYFPRIFYILVTNINLIFFYINRLQIFVQFIYLLATDI